MRVLNFIFSVINFFLTIIFSIGLVMAVVSSITDPSSVWWLTYFSVAAPIFVVATVVMLLINLIRIKLLLFVPLVALLATLPLVGSQFMLPVEKDYIKDASFLKIMTHNIYLFKYDKHKNALDSTTHFIKEQKPDIIAFQEFIYDRDVDQKLIKSLASTHKYHNISLNNSLNYGIGIATISKYPIVNKGTLHSDSEIAYAQWSDIAIGIDTVRFFNVHLHSNHITQQDKEFLSAANIIKSKIDTTNKKTLKAIFKKLGDNTIMRSMQADSIALLIEKSPYEVMVAGDFNDVPFSYSFNTIKSGLNDSFAEKGAGYAFTYNQLEKFLKIDYILSSKKFDVSSYSSKNVDYSDHNPIVVTLQKPVFNK